MKPYVVPGVVTGLTLLGLVLSRSSGEAKKDVPPPPPPPPPVVPDLTKMTTAEMLEYATALLTKASTDPTYAASLDPVFLRALADQLETQGYGLIAVQLRVLAASIDKPATGFPGGPGNRTPREDYLVKSAGDLITAARQNIRAQDPVVMNDIADELDRDYKTHRNLAHILRIWAKCVGDLKTNPNVQVNKCGPYDYTGQDPAPPVQPTGAPGTPGILPADLAKRLTDVLNDGIPQTSLGPINAVINELNKYQGFEPQKQALQKRKMALKTQGL